MNWQEWSFLENGHGELVGENGWTIDVAKRHKNGVTFKVQWSPGKDRDPWQYEAFKSGEKPFRHGRAKTFDEAMTLAEGRKRSRR